MAVTGVVSLLRQGGGGKTKADSSNAVVWLKPVTGAAPPVAPRRLKIIQHHKRFDPHVLVAPAGSVVDFPNLDPFFHNVFSMFDGKRFDLGLYEAGASHSVTFDRPGVCFIFCNIHPEMSAVVVVADTPYYAISNAMGGISIPAVPPGRYVLTVWHERGKPESPDAIPHEVTISAETAALPPIRLIDSAPLMPSHKNKYGRDYDPPAPSGGVYK